MSNKDDKEYTEANNVWLTLKSRMHAENRYKSYSLVSHLLLSYYALIMIFISIFSNNLPPYLPLTQINIALSTAILSASLIIYGFKFGETAQLHRECYLRLQRLLALVDDEKILVEKYHEIISGYPNHSTNDYDDLVIDRTLTKKGTLGNSKGPVRWTGWMLFKKIVRWVTFWAWALSLAISPAFLIWGLP